MKYQFHTSHHIGMEPGDVAYIRLPGFEEGAKVARTVSLRDVIKTSVVAPTWNSIFQKMAF